jgi:hypothetical protein
MAKYMLLIHQDGKRWSDADESITGTIHIDYIKYTQELIDAGVMVGGDPITGPETAKVVSPGGVVTDGPFAETAEQLGGYYVIDVADDAAAVEWASRLPGVVHGLDRIEVRAVAVLPDMPTP